MKLRLLSSIYCCRGYTALFYWLANPVKKFISFNCWHKTTGTQESTDTPEYSTQEVNRTHGITGLTRESGWTMHSQTSIHQTTNHPQRSWSSKLLQLDDPHQWGQSVNWPLQYTRLQSPWADKWEAVAQLTSLHSLTNLHHWMLYKGSQLPWWTQWVHSPQSPLIPNLRRTLR